LLDRQLDNVSNCIRPFPSPCFSQPAHNGLFSGYSLSPKKLMALQTVTHHTPTIPATKQGAKRYSHLATKEFILRKMKGMCEPVVSHGYQKHCLWDLHGNITPERSPADQCTFRPCPQPGDPPSRKDPDELEHNRSGPDSLTTTLKEGGSAKAHPDGGISLIHGWS
jgi:hypothetical protein